MKIGYQQINSEQELNESIELYNKSNLKTIDIYVKTTGDDIVNDKIKLLQISAPALPVLMINIENFKQENLKIIERLLNRDEIIKNFYNAKFTLKFIKKIGLNINLSKIFDLMIAEGILVNGINLKSLELVDIIKKYLKYETVEECQLNNWYYFKNNECFMCKSDNLILSDLRNIIRKEIIANNLIDTCLIEFRATRAIVEMEMTGIHINKDKINLLIKNFNTERQEAQNAFYAESGEVVNINSSCEIKNWLIKKGFHVEKTDKCNLIKLLPKFSMIKYILDFKKAEKNLQIAKKISESIRDDGRLYSNYNQLGAESGRFTCNDFNLQQVPHNKKFRECFEASKGYKLIIADYSQIELRIVAEISREERMIVAYKNGADLHLLTAALINNKTIEQVTKDERQAAKALNFGLIYGMGANGLADYALTNYGVIMSLPEATKFREKFFKAYPGLKKWHQVNYNSKVKHVFTLGKRRRILNDEATFMQRVNTPVQGTGADMLKLVLCMLPDLLKPLNAKIIAIVHDEIILECLENISAEAAKILEGAMIAAGKQYLKVVPVIAETKIVSNWSEK